MTIHFEGAAIIGVGLLGASLGLALKKRNTVSHITGVGRRPASLEIARARGAVDSIATDAVAGATGADLVVIATPARLVAPMLDLVLPVCAEGALIIDVASTKGAICAHARQVCPKPRCFIGCHPMAGAESYGPENGRADLFRDRVCLVEKDDELDPDARIRACALWRSCGARVVDLDVHAHDVILARTSHAPHVAAVALALVADTCGARRDMIGNGFLDTTRIALSRPEIWRDICLENREVLRDVLAEIRGRLSDFENLLAAADGPGIETYFEAGAEARMRVMGS